MEAEQQYHCSVCSFSVSGFSNYQMHVNSLEHANMIRINYERTSNCGDVDNKQAIPKSTITTKSSMTVIAPFAECKPCNKQFSGPEPYQQHLASAAHKKKCGVHSSFQIQKDQNFVSKKLLRDSEQAVSTCYSSDVITLPFVKCEICKMQFKDGTLYELHLESANHREKTGARVLLKSDTIGNSETFQDYTKCIICDMIFSGPQPYEQHLQGKSHKKKIELAKKKGIDFQSVAPESTSHNSVKCKEECNTATVPNSCCDVCKKQCSGPIAYKEHILSKGHGQNLRITLTETNMKRIKESGLWPGSGLSNTNSFTIAGEVSATSELISEVDDFNNGNNSSSNE
ncbi:zinc finger protein [Nephila pilipes]|uniref:Zinc finger protein n=1 Tax=Nephila pilipes TaxID=299642 RepID=A0A8X6U9D8_NEPPI|nr:zinc finger protein [Nephila pilipes]